MRAMTVQASPSHSSHYNHRRRRARLRRVATKATNARVMMPAALQLAQGGHEGDERQGHETPLTIQSADPLVTTGIQLVQRR